MSGISEEEKWECYLCGCESDYDKPVAGWLGNYQMLCLLCADSVYFNLMSKFHQALTYHYSIGDIRVENIFGNCEP